MTRLTHIPTRGGPPPPTRGDPPILTHTGAPKKHAIMTKSILYKRYRELLFQTIAMGYLIKCVQNGSSNSILKQLCLHIILKNHKITRLSFHLGAQQKIRKVVTKHNFI